MSRVIEAPSHNILSTLGLLPLNRGRLCAAATPLLKQRINLLGDDEDWPSYLTWDKSAMRAFAVCIKEVANGSLASETLEGFARLDEETILAVKQITVHGSECPLWVTLALCVDSNTFALEWRIRELSCQSPPDRGLVLCDTLGDLLNSAQVPSKPLASKEGPVAEDDDYWAQYDQDSDGSTGEPTPATKTAQGESEEDYYSRYEQVETMIPEKDQSSSDGAPQDSTRNAMSAAQVAVLQHCASTVQSLKTLLEASDIPISELRVMLEHIL
ncbi:hypothetical protein BCR37DRAFT_382519 [Protomyces lactucae-debilis]|uniref:Uncharacterized protein n=1 Tax=Protomyces lactucae-debilis TaxID=2754530 RepID=A0A1Y2F324_PROLT|nr:uncharacterized protein BCR37DRAFT_382519 [Protomyces lactucae-debilis]ORY78243.1 hypothetical protein BCR37DRAFT_382519 [Protomyces lactucae-debilis]